MLCINRGHADIAPSLHDTLLLLLVLCWDEPFFLPWLIFFCRMGGSWNRRRQGYHIRVLPRGGGRVAGIRYLKACYLRERGAVAQGASRSCGGQHRGHAGGKQERSEVTITRQTPIKAKHIEALFPYCYSYINAFRFCRSYFVVLLLGAHSALPLLLAGAQLYCRNAQDTLLCRAFCYPFVLIYEATER